MGERRERWWVWAGFAVLCLVAGSRWILADARPEMGSTLRSEAWACGVAAMVCAGRALLARRSLPGVRKVAGLLLAGAGVLAAPAVGAVLRGSAGESLNRALALAFVPVVAMMWSGSSRLWPALAGLAGALLVLPFTAPSGVGGYVGLAVVPLAVGAACGVLRVRDVSLEWAAALLLGGGALGLLLLEVARVAMTSEVAQSFSAAAVGLDAVEAVLVVAVVLRVGGVRYAARYFVVLLVMLLEGGLLLRAGFSVRLGAGMLLLAVAAVGLLRGGGTEGDTPGLHLR